MRYEEFKITEAALVTLKPANILKNRVRFDNLINMIKSGNPLYTVDGTEVIIAPTEAPRLIDLEKNGEFKGNVTLQGKDGKPYPLGSFLKTKEFGGQAIPPGSSVETAEISKEAAALKPSNIGIVDRQIQAADLHSEIMNANYKVQEAGDVVKEMSKEIAAGQNPDIPIKELGKGIVAAINDYAGEYLGVQALIQGTSSFPNKDAFTKWLGNDIKNLVLVFPEAANAPLADSYALINPDTGHQLNISSKGKGGGAPPSIGSLKVPPGLRNKSAYTDAINFIDLVKGEGPYGTGQPKPTTISQPFIAMNLIYKSSPKAINSKFHEFLPWSLSSINEIIATRKEKTDLPAYQKLWAGRLENSRAADYGKLTYVVKEEVMRAINDGELPGFDATILEILGYNFIQQDAKVVRGVMNFATQWPAKLNAKVTVETKAGATDPTKGSFSFKLHF